MRAQNYYLGTFLSTKREIASGAAKNALHVLQLGVARETYRFASLFGSSDGGLFSENYLTGFEVFGSHHAPNYITLLLVELYMNKTECTFRISRARRSCKVCTGSCEWASAVSGAPWRSKRLRRILRISAWLSTDTRRKFGCWAIPDDPWSPSIVMFVFAPRLNKKGTVESQTV